MIVARLRTHMRGHPKTSAVSLQNERGTTTVRTADAQHWSNGPLKLMALPTMSRLGLSARHSDLVFEGCVKRQGCDVVHRKFDSIGVSATGTQRRWLF